MSKGEAICRLEQQQWIDQHGLKRLPEGPHVQMAFPKWHPHLPFFVPTEQEEIELLLEDCSDHSDEQWD